MNRAVTIFGELSILDAMSKHEQVVAQYLLKFLQNCGLNPITDNSAPQTGSNTGNVICPVNGGGDFVVLCHMDTARSTKDSHFIVTDDAIVSDGTAQIGIDDRAGIAILLATLEEAIHQQIPLKAFTLLFTCCEENTLFGSKYAQLDKAIKKGFIFDSYMDPGTIIHNSCGAIMLKARFIGRSAHAGISPESGINAIQAATKALTHFPYGRINPWSTANIGTIHGGTATNVVPASVEVEGEIRSFDSAFVEETVAKVKADWQSICQQYGVSLDFEWFWDFMPFTLETQSDVYKQAEQAILASGLTPSSVKSLGGSDANSLNARGIDTVNLGVGSKNPHSDNETILLDHIRQSAAIFRNLIIERTK